MPGPARSIRKPNLFPLPTPPTQPAKLPSTSPAMVTGEAQTSNLPKRILLSSLSAAVAETATFPIDTIKTRLQLHSHSTPASAFHVATDVWRSETGGFLGFSRGLSPAILRHVFYTPIRILGYEHLGNGFPDGVGSLRSESFVWKALCGGVSGVVAQVVASPADLIKVRMQADGRLASQGLEPRYVGVLDAFGNIVRVGGIRGLFKGVLPDAQIAFLVNMGELACYDNAKHFIINKNIVEDGIYAHSLASVASGLCATTLSCPADVIKTRMMVQAACEEKKAVFRNSLDCLLKTVRLEGIMASWKGFFPTWARLGFWQFVFWVSYEKFRYVSGFPSF